MAKPTIRPCFAAAGMSRAWKAAEPPDARSLVFYAASPGYRYELALAQHSSSQRKKVQ